MSDAERLQHIVNRVDSSPWTGAFGGEDEDLDDVKWLVNKYDRAKTDAEYWHDAYDPGIWIGVHDRLPEGAEDIYRD